MNTDDVFFLNTDWHGLNGGGNRETIMYPENERSNSLIGFLTLSTLHHPQTLNSKLKKSRLGQRRACSFFIVFCTSSCLQRVRDPVPIAAIAIHRVAPVPLVLARCLHGSLFLLLPCPPATPQRVPRSWFVASC